MSFKSTVTVKWAGDAYKAAFDKEMLEAYERSGTTIAASARSRIHNVSGKLARSVRVGVSQKQKEVFVFAGSKRDKLLYAAPVEYGTSDKSAHPFMRPAVDTNRYSTLEEADREGRRIVNRQRRLRKVK